MRQIDLSYNKIKRIKSEYFVPALLILKINDNSIKYISDSDFDFLGENIQCLTYQIIK